MNITGENLQDSGHIFKKYFKSKTMKDLKKIANALGYEIELDQIESKGWMRLRHSKAPEDKEWSLIVYKDDNFEGAIGRMGDMLVRVGKHIKINQILEI